MNGPFHEAGRYVRTVAGLRPSQVVHRVRLRGQRALLARLPAKFLDRPAPSRPVAAGWPHSFTPVDAVAADLAFPSAEDNAAGRFRFLEEARALGEPPDWDQAGASHLWRYHLHYFEWAWAFASHPDRDWARLAFARLVESWRARTVTGRGVAWSPYVASLRAWAWCGVHEGLIAGTALDEAWTASLATHASFLRRHLELDVGGNHLVKNLKALVGLGVFLDDGRTVASASARLGRQLPVQVLADGGHYERSPSYHAQVLGDLIDVGNLLAAAGRPPVPGLDEAVEAMRRWLGAVILPDGDVPLFNDGALVGRARLAALEPAAPPAETTGAGPTILEPSGYVVSRGRFHLVADVGPPCPPDLPAHAHADCLSFELAVDGRRIIVDTGTSTYAAGPRRSWERSTAAHNTVEIDGQDQTEVWSAFRAGLRAEPRREGPLSASHGGYERLPGKPRHRRTWRVTDSAVEVLDEVSGGGVHEVIARLHVAPGVPVEAEPDGAVTAGPLRIAVDGPGAAVSVEPADLATGFGRLDKGHVVVVRTDGRLPLVLRTTLTLTIASTSRPAS